MGFPHRLAPCGVYDDGVGKLYLPCARRLPPFPCLLVDRLRRSRPHHPLLPSRLHFLGTQTGKSKSLNSLFIPKSKFPNALFCVKKDTNFTIHETTHTHESIICNIQSGCGELPTQHAAGVCLYRAVECGQVEPYQYAHPQPEVSQAQSEAG